MFSITQHPISNFISYHRLNSFFRAFTNNLRSVFIPETIQEALAITKWKKLIQEEMMVLDENGSWELVSLLFGTVGCKKCISFLKN